MLDLEKYQSIGAALKDALNQFANETCLIEADREREKERLTYRDFQQRGSAVARTRCRMLVFVPTIAPRLS